MYSPIALSVANLVGLPIIHLPPDRDEMAEVAPKPAIACAGPGERKCKTCGEIKKMRFFPKAGRGYISECKPCWSVSLRKKRKEEKLSKGKPISIFMVAQDAGVSRGRLMRLIAKGMSIEEAIASIRATPLLPGRINTNCVQVTGYPSLSIACARLGLNLKKMRELRRRHRLSGDETIARGLKKKME